MMSKMTNIFNPELRERAARLVLKHSSEWATMISIAAKIGCTAEAIWHWVQQANHIAHKARAYFAQAESDRRFNP